MKKRKEHEGGGGETAESPPSGADVACRLPAGDMAAVQELRNFPAAFSQVDESGWYPFPFSHVSFTTGS